MAYAWINLLLLGGLLGALGQGVRAIVGLKKTYDAALASDKEFSEVFKPGVLVFSLVIGFVAGGLGALTTLPDPCIAGARCDALSKEALLALVAIGYAGTDFIEGFVRKHLPAENGPKLPKTGDGGGDTGREPDDDAPAGGNKTTMVYG